LKEEAGDAFYISVKIYQNTPHHIPKYSNFQNSLTNKERSVCIRIGFVMRTFTYLDESPCVGQKGTNILEAVGASIFTVEGSVT
jgi:hypothetical protein